MIDTSSIEIIKFGADLPTLEDFQSVFWVPGTSKEVEFFKNQRVSVTVVDIENTTQLTECLKNLLDGHPMSIDFEWKPDNSSNPINPISLFQIGSSKGVLIVLNSQKIINHGRDYHSADFFKACPEGLSIMKEFLSSNLFYGKGMSCDRKKLKQLFGQEFQMEDIDISRLQQHELTSNFGKLVSQLIGEPDAQFKDQKISKSNWNDRPLSVKQILYAAFDAYATRLFWNHFITKYGEAEFIDSSQIEKDAKKVKKQKSKDKTKKEKNKEDSNALDANQSQKNYKPKFDLKVSFHSVNDYLYLLDDEDKSDFDYGFKEIKNDSDNFVKTGVFPTGYDSKESLKRRILCLEDIVELPEKSRFFCKICNTEIDGLSLDNHIWMKHYDQLPYVYFPDQSPKYISKCLQTIYLACSNFEFYDAANTKNGDNIKSKPRKSRRNKKRKNKNNCLKEEKSDVKEDNNNENKLNAEEDKDNEKNENFDVKENDDDDDDTENEIQISKNSNSDNEVKEIKNNDDDDDDDIENEIIKPNDDNSTKTVNSQTPKSEIYGLESEVICTLCNNHFTNFSTFFAHIQHMHSKLSIDDFTMTVKDLYFYYLTKLRLFDPTTHKCRLCERTLDTENNTETDSDHCWLFHGDEIVKMLKHKPNRYSESCFRFSFPLGVLSIHPMNAGSIFKGSISCGFCRIGFDDPGELFVHLFHRHTRCIVVSISELEKWPLKASDLHAEFLEVMEKWCCRSAVEALEEQKILEELEEEEEAKNEVEKKDEKDVSEKKDEKDFSEKKDEKDVGEKKDEKDFSEKKDEKDAGEKSKKKGGKEKKKKKKKLLNNTTRVSYRCNECDQDEIFHSQKQLWNHIIHNHMIITFDFIE